MAELIIMPKLGFNMDEGKLIEWYKAEGDKIPVTLPIAIIADADEDVSAMETDALARLAGEGVNAAPAAEAPAAETPKAGGCDYEIAVIGGGPGGYVAAIKAAQLGRKTVIFEKEHFGGTCLNVGCIPTKALLASAESLKQVKGSAAFGVTDIDTADAKLDLQAVQARKRGIIGQLVGGVQALLKGNGVTIEENEAKLIDKNTIEAGGKRITADNIILATGSGVKRLPIRTDKGMKVLTSKEMLDIEEAPENMVVIGGGVIGIEFAYFLSTIGVTVTVIEFLDRILPMVDEEITAQVTAHLKDMGIRIHTSAAVTEITANAVKFEKNGKEESVECDQVLMAVGRVPDLTGIDTEALGIKTERGAIVTDKHLKTSVPGIYAIGDVNGKAMLAHTASAEGIAAVETICGKKAEINYDWIPSAIYIQPEIASIGLTEKAAIEKYGKVKVGKFPMVGNGKAKVAGDDKGLIKIISEPRYGEIVGVHMYCIRATDMIAEAAAVMKLEGTAEEIAATVHPHPTVSEAVAEAMHAVNGRAIHF